MNETKGEVDGAAAIVAKLDSLQSTLAKDQASLQSIVATGQASLQSIVATGQASLQLTLHQLSASQKELSNSILVGNDADSVVRAGAGSLAVFASR